MHPSDPKTFPSLSPGEFALYPLVLAPGGLFLVGDFSPAGALLLGCTLYGGEYLGWCWSRRCLPVGYPLGVTLLVVVVFLQWSPFEWGWLLYGLAFYSLEYPLLFVPLKGSPVGGPLCSSSRTRRERTSR